MASDENLPRGSSHAVARPPRSTSSNNRTSLLPRRPATEYSIRQVSSDPWVEFEVHRRSAAYYIRQYLSVLADLNTERAEQGKSHISRDLILGSHALNNPRLCRSKIAKDSALRDLSLLSFSLDILRDERKKGRGVNRVAYVAPGVLISATSRLFFTNYLLSVCAGIIAAGGGGFVWVYGALWNKALSDCVDETERLARAFEDDDICEGDREALASGGFWMLDNLRDIHNALV